MMMLRKLMYSLGTVLLINGFTVILGMAQSADPKIGAYYFDGWSGTTFHITDELRQSYPEREPIWGWMTSSQEIVDEQIKYAWNENGEGAWLTPGKKGLNPLDGVKQVLR